MVWFWRIKICFILLSAGLLSCCFGGRTGSNARRSLPPGLSEAASDVSCGADSLSQHFAVCFFSTASVLEPSCDWQNTARGPHSCPAAQSRTSCCPSMNMVMATTFFNDRIMTGHGWKWPETGSQTIEEGSSEEPQGPHWPRPPCMSPGTPWALAHPGSCRSSRPAPSVPHWEGTQGWVSTKREWPSTAWISHNPEATRCRCTGLTFGIQVTPTCCKAVASVSSSVKWTQDSNAVIRVVTGEHGWCPVGLLG